MIRSRLRPRFASFLKRSASKFSLSQPVTFRAICFIKPVRAHASVPAWDLIGSCSIPKPTIGETYESQPMLCTVAASQLESKHMSPFDCLPRPHAADTIVGLQGDEDCSSGSVACERTRKRKDRRGHDCGRPGHSLRPDRGQTQW